MSEWKNLQTSNWKYTSNFDFYDKINDLFAAYDERFIFFNLYENKSFHICYKKFKESVFSNSKNNDFLALCDKIDKYFSYFDSILNLKYLFINKNNYTLTQRREIISTTYNNYDELISMIENPNYLSYYNEQLFGEKDSFIYMFKQLNSYMDDKINEDKYYESKKLLDKVLNFFYENKHTTADNTYNTVIVRKYFNEEKVSKYELRDALESFEETYLISFVNDETIPLSKYYSIDDFYSLFRILKRIYEMAFHEKYVIDGNAKHHIKSDEEINKLYLLLKKYMKETNNKYEILHKLIFEENYTDKILNESIYSFNEYIDKNIIHVKAKDSFIDLFREITTLSRDFKTVSKGVYSLLISNDEKKDLNIQLTYEILYKYNISPIKLYQKLKDTPFARKYKTEAELFVEQYRPIFEAKEIEKQKVIEEQEKVKEEQEKINISRFEIIVSDFIESKVQNITDYCDSINIKENEFQYMLNALNEYKSPVFTKYKEHTKMLKKQRMDVMISKIMEKLNEAIESKTNLNLLDYYECTSLKPSEVSSRIGAEFTCKEQKEAWKKFVRNHGSDKELNEEGINSLLNNLKVKYCIQVDNKGNILKSYEVTKEDKEQTLLILKEKNIPITNATFNLMLRKYYNENILPSLIDTKTKNI